MQSPLITSNSAIILTMLAFCEGEALQMTTDPHCDPSWASRGSSGVPNTCSSVLPSITSSPALSPHVRKHTNKLSQHSRLCCTVLKCNHGTQHSSLCVFTFERYTKPAVLCTSVMFQHRQRKFWLTSFCFISVLLLFRCRFWFRYCGVNLTLS